MLFSSFQYPLFLIGSLLIFFCLPYRWRLYFLWAVSMASAFLWSWISGVILLLETAIAGVVARYVDRETDERKRKWGVGVAAVLLLAGLAVFKYGNFFLDSCSLVRSWFGRGAFPHWKFLLPIGISFYSFMCLGYVIDVYRKKCAAETNWFRLSLFAGFFPHFASGPIGQAGTLLPQFRDDRHCTPENLEIGFRLILWGLFKKVVIADRLAAWADPVFARPEMYSGATALVAMYFFTIQIYCDFSGYSDIAIGSAKMFGIDLMQNFRQPYFADSIYEFWKRWHISLTSWFRNYMYIPMGGNRVPFWRWQFNIFMVFLVSGLWHGAAWTFVIWGAMHGIVYLLERWSKKGVERLCPNVSFAWAKGLRILFTFHIVAVAWIFFRSASFSSAAAFLARMCGHWGAFQWGATKIPVCIAFGRIVFLFCAEVLIALGWSGDYLKKGRCSGWLRCAGYGGLLCGLALLGVRSNTFIYLQF